MAHDNTPDSTPVSTTPACTLLGSYDISDDEVCEILAFCQPCTAVGGRTMLARGKADQASMDEAAFQKWWLHRDKVSSQFWGNYFAFPEASDANGDVRYAVRDDGSWHHYRGGLGRGWDGSVVLVRFRRKRS